uniref:Uncharacterized protein n=1 Tax=Favella ehrenbergii TaxID=182087 RepID=A0A7S3I717_9SPIT|mmetsp:Transcript_6931/g.8307  ORF Transcript_6931/g.8307 Transcript_6931/m.8307 type:complete len:142 (+) Transcript_6931:250-675(+)|eukprot:CAMPEP_0170471752 /NCGR_PEP_ID=MMETSP0123-20130129/13922_1 /TAXON_ID=182087 /ORGANISM="Favella ehrenbergii, Strain Fehren 1" /LENGTH=141 /DNA_ID=CAMNT_0010739615 /DNA_START=199 /DNA_END=621 /DNA_ORIENTATION=+
MTAINRNMTARKLDDQDGNATYQFNVNTPAIVSDRTMFITYYNSKDAATRATTIVSGSEGNAAFEESEVEQIDGRVVGHLVVTYISFVPAETGYTVEQVSCFNPEGWIPGFVQSLGVRTQAEIVRQLIDYLVNGTVPEPFW